MMFVISLLTILLFMNYNWGNHESSWSSLNLASIIINSNNFSFSTRNSFLRLSDSLLKNSELPTVYAIANSDLHCSSSCCNSESRYSSMGFNLCRSVSETLKMDSWFFLKSRSVGCFCISSMRCCSSFFFWNRFYLRLYWSTADFMRPYTTYIFCLIR